MTDCVIANIHLAKDQCQFVLDNCQDVGETVHFLNLYYCQANSSSIILIIASLLVFVLSFHFLLRAAERCLSSALTYLSVKIKCSQALAGVTLLAFANGAQDVITAIVAGDQDGGIELAIGSIFGASLFVQTYVVSRVVYFSHELDLSQTNIKRDLIFNILCTLVVVLFGIIKTIYWWMSIGFIAIYLIYIAVVLVQERKNNKILLESQIEENKNDLLGIQSSQILHDESLNNVLLSKKQLEKIAQDEQDKQEDKSDRDSEVHTKNQEIRSFLKQVKESRAGSLKSLLQQARRSRNWEMQSAIQQKSKRIFYILHQDFESFKDKLKEQEPLEKIQTIYEALIDILLDFTIPSCSEDQWQKYKCIAQLFIFPYFSLILLNDLDMSVGFIKLVYIFPAISFILSLFVYFTSHQDKSPRYFVVFNILGLIQSVLWISYIAQIIVDFLLFFQVISNINAVYIGLTFLAIGNALQDCIVDQQLAKEGFGLMAIGGCYAGPLFNLLLGFGGSLFNKTVLSSFSNLPFDIFAWSDNDSVQNYQNLIIWGVLGFSMGSQLLTLIYVRTRVKVTIGFSYILLCVFVSFIILETVFSTMIDLV